MSDIAFEVNVIGAGPAGCEAANLLASFGIRVKLYEMKPEMKSPAHHSDGFCRTGLAAIPSCSEH